MITAEGIMRSLKRPIVAFDMPPNVLDLYWAYHDEFRPGTWGVLVFMQNEILR